MKKIAALVLAGTLATSAVAEPAVKSNMNPADIQSATVSTQGSLPAEGVFWMLAAIAVIAVLNSTYGGKY